MARPLPDLPTLREEIRRELGQRYLEVQALYRRTHKPDEIVPEMLAALVQLAAMIAHMNADLDPVEFIRVCVLATQIEWKNVSPSATGGDEPSG